MENMDVATRILVNYAIDLTMNNAVTRNPRVQLTPSVHISDLEFADVLVVLGDSRATVQPILDRIIL